PTNAVLSTSLNLNVGSYQLGASNVTGASGNFSNTIVVVGTQQVTPLALSATVSNPTKVYDGTTAMSGFSLALSNLLSGGGNTDSVTASGTGVYNGSQKNVGTGLGYSVGNITLSGTDAGNYALTSVT